MKRTPVNFERSMTVVTKGWQAANTDVFPTVHSLGGDRGQLKLRLRSQAGNKNSYAGKERIFYRQ